MTTKKITEGSLIQHGYGRFSIDTEALNEQGFPARVDDDGIFGDHCTALVRVTVEFLDQQCQKCKKPIPLANGEWESHVKSCSGDS